LVKLEKFQFLDCIKASKKLSEIEYFDYLIFRLFKEAYPTFHTEIYLCKERDFIEWSQFAVRMNPESDVLSDGFVIRRLVYIVN
jgi:hypothetical protein